MYTRQRIWFQRVLIVAVFSCFGIGGYTFFRTNRIIQSPIPLQELLIDASAYPIGWQSEGTIRADHDEGEYSNLALVLRFQGEESTVSVLKAAFYDPPEQAAYAFQRLPQADMLRGEHMVLDVVGYTSQDLRADRTRVRCSYGGGDYQRCKVYALYGAYLIEFSARIDNRSMSQAIFRELFSKIDIHIADRIALSKQTP